MDLIRVFSIDLDEPLPLERARALLSPDERERADRLRVEPAARRFTLARAALRTLLAECLDASPRALTFTYGPHGKPSLPGPLQFNLSHSRGLALVALAVDAEVGVDVEKEREVPDALDIARRMFAPAEREALASVDERFRSAAFLRCWTRKEAFVKTTGDGLRLPLDAFEVTFVDPTGPARLLRVDATDGSESPFRMAALAPAPGFWGALCWRGRERALELQVRALGDLLPG